MKKSSRRVWLAALVCAVGLWPVLVLALVDHHGFPVAETDDPAACLVCHDGNVAKMVGACTVRCDFRDSHSILRDYPSGARSDEFYPVEELGQKGLRLANGKIVCTTCHNLKNTSPAHLVITMDGSALCQSCHRK